jgi:hypothetical protein
VTHTPEELETVLAYRIAIKAVLSEAASQRRFVTVRELTDLLEPRPDLDNERDHLVFTTALWAVNAETFANEGIMLAALCVTERNNMPVGGFWAQVHAWEECKHTDFSRRRSFHHAECARCFSHFMQRIPKGAPGRIPHKRSEIGE